MSRINRLINKAFRQRGLSVKADAARVLRKTLQETLEADPTVSVSVLLENIVNAVKTQHNCVLVDSKTIDSVLHSLVSESKTAVNEDPIVVVDAFHTPAFTYDAVHKVFQQASSHLSLHGDAGDKSSMFRNRYDTVLQRVQRHFAKATLGQDDDAVTLEITEIGALLGRPGTKCILGLLTEQKEGVYFCEDPHHSVQLDLTNAKILTGMFTTNCMVLAQGELDDDVFVASELGFPPVESGVDTVRVFPNLDLFGLSTFKAGDRKRLLQQQYEQEPDDHMMVVASDIWLDKPEVMDKLRTMFSGYAGMEPPPPLFVLMGDFMSAPPKLIPTHVQKLREHFDKLADLIASFPELTKNSKFVLIPGPSDPGYGNTLPRPGFSPMLTQRLRQKIPHITLASNPCRILYFAHSMVLFRENLLHKMRRNCVLKPDSDDLTEHLTRTICDQGHLCPLSTVSRPIYWNYDHALRLYPLPDAIVLADEYQQYEWAVEHTTCTVLNPGQFATDYSFVVYQPCKMDRRIKAYLREVAPSLISQDDDEELDDVDMTGSQLPDPSSRVEFSRIDI